MSGWSWKDSGGGCGRLLYEPGNWGDILKGCWLVRCLDFLTSNSNNFSYLDVFAGYPEYPLSLGSLSRLRQFDDERLLEASGEYLDRSAWPSASSLAKTILDTQAVVKVFDCEEQKRQSYRECGGVDVLSGSDGWEVLAGEGAIATTLILVDPYDFLSGWRNNLHSLVSLTGKSSVLLYVYNRSGRSREMLRDYRDFRNELARSGVNFLMGRAASDGFVPDAWHEMYFFPSSAATDINSYRAFCESLRSITQRLSDTISCSAVFEEM